KRPQRGLELALGIDQKIGGGDDALACAETLQHDEIVTGPRAELDFPRLKISAAAVHECDLARAGVNHSRSRNRELISKRQAETNIDEHSEQKLHVRIRNLQAHAGPAHGHIHFWPN